MELMAIGYPDSLTAIAAMDDLESLSRDFGIRPDEIAAIVRDEDGTLKTFANAHIAVGEDMWAMFWGPLFGMLFFIPFLGMPIGSQLEPIIQKVEGAGIDPEFQERIRAALTPGASALFFLVEKVNPDSVVAALDHYGGTVLQCALTRDAENRLQEALHGRPAVGL